MLQFRISDTSEDIIVTLSEKETLTAPYYHFVFTHVTTKDVVEMVTNDDTSGYQSRYNQFTINPATLFENKLPGQWNYEVYERQTAISEDVTLLEQGILQLLPSTDFSFTTYSTTTNFKAYNGE